MVTIMIGKLKMWKLRRSNVWKAMLRYGATLTECPHCHTTVPQYQDGISSCLFCNKEIEGKLYGGLMHLPKEIQQTERGTILKFNVPSIRPHEIVRVGTTVIVSSPDKKQP